MSQVKMINSLGLLWLPGVAALLMLVATQLVAQEDLQIPPEIPPIDTEAEALPEEALPPKVQDEQIEPTVTIREEEERRVEEYSRNGQVYMVKITPKGGVPYYYIDTDGDGNLEASPSKGLEPVRPVYWKVKEWP